MPVLSPWDSSRDLGMLVWVSLQQNRGTVQIRCVHYSQGQGIPAKLTSLLVGAKDFRKIEHCAITSHAHKRASGYLWQA